MASLFDFALSGALGAPHSYDPPQSLTVVPINAAPSPGAILAAVEAYRRLADRTDLPQLRVLTAARTTKLCARLKECSGLTGWLEALDKLERSSFCRGCNDRGWRADFDFLLQPSSFARLIEGRYDDRTATRPADASATSRALAALARGARPAADD